MITITKDNWESKVKDMVDEKINDLFYEVQEVLDIRYGDITPGELFDLDDKQEELANLIIEIIKHQYENELEIRESEGNCDDEQ